jgi:ubiquinone biosynthesis protein
MHALPPVMRAGVRFGRLFERGEVRGSGRVERLSRALHRLGPTYVKLGQTLATRPDIVGPQEVAADLAVLQDKMEPFDRQARPGPARRSTRGDKALALTEFSAPVAAASIAQVHKATLTDETGRRTVAVKLLRPGIRERFRADIESQYAGARLAEALVPKLKRLRPVDVVAIARPLGPPRARPPPGGGRDLGDSTRTSRPIPASPSPK